MLKKIIEKLRTPGVLIFGAVLLVAVAGVVLALCLRDPATSPPSVQASTGQSESTAESQPGGETAPPDWIDDPVTEPSPGEEPAQTDPTETSGSAEQPTQPLPVEPTGDGDPQSPTTAPTSPDTPDVSDPVPQDPLAPQVTEPVKDPADLKIRQYSSFTGIYVEDGSDEPVENVAAILVTNPTDRYLDMGTVICDIDGKEGKFLVTGLPAGASAWVMEVSRMTVTADSVFLPKSCDTTYRSNAVSSTEDVTIQSAGTMLRAVNNTGKTLKNVTVYYKVLHTDGNFFGGITYMVTFGDLEPGASAEKLAGHFKEGWTTIVRIGYQSE